MFEPRVEGAVELTVQSRVFLAQTADGVPVDIAFGAIEFERNCVARASEFDFGAGIILKTCSAEDLIVMKVFANRDRDWADVESIITRRGWTLDWNLIERELKPLLAVQGGETVWNRLSEIHDRQP